jgi:hypothetical protein
VSEPRMIDRQVKCSTQTCSCQNIGRTMSSLVSGLKAPLLVGRDCTRGTCPKEANGNPSSCLCVDINSSPSSCAKVIQKGANRPQVRGDVEGPASEFRSGCRRLVGSIPESWGT